MTDEGHLDDRARAIAEKAWQQWTHGGADMKDGAGNRAIIQVIGKVVIESYITGMTDDEWLRAVIERLDELERDRPA
jgi:hypothetical protein